MKKNIQRIAYQGNVRMQKYIVVIHDGICGIDLNCTTAALYLKYILRTSRL